MVREAHRSQASFFRGDWTDTLISPITVQRPLAAPSPGHSVWSQSLISARFIFSPSAGSRSVIQPTVLSRSNMKSSHDYLEGHVELLPKRAVHPRVDETRTSCSYGISRDEIHRVMDGLIPGSGRILDTSCPSAPVTARSIRAGGYDR